MDNYQLIKLYQKLIQSHSEENLLYNMRQYSTIFNNESLIPSMIADIRYSREYLSLLTNEKAFNSTYESLTYLYNREKGHKNNRKNLSSDYQEWMFEKIFTNEEKIIIQEIVSNEFGGEKVNSNKIIKQPMIHYENTKEVNNREKNLFCQMLQLIFCQDDIIKRRPAPKPKNDQSVQKVQKEQFNVGKILTMMF